MMKVQNTNDHIYLNVSINPTSTTGNSLALYEETFSRPILTNTADYYLSVARFSCPLTEIPILYFPLDIYQNSAIVSNLIIGIRTVGLVYFPQTVNFTAQNNSPLPTPALTSPYFTPTQATSKCYEIFSFTAFLAMINTALTAAALAAGILAADVPYYTYDPVTQLFSLHVTALFVASGAQIYMNERCNNYLASFRYYQQFNPTNNDDYYHILPLGAGPFTIQEDFISVSLWYDIRKLLLTSSTLPVVQEVSPTQSEITGLSQGVISFSPILTDFIISFDNTTQSFTYGVYSPDTYRLIDFSTNANIDKLNLQFFWLTKNGQKIPVEISNTQTCTIKLAFLRKPLYTNQW